MASRNPNTDPVSRKKARATNARSNSLAKEISETKKDAKYYNTVERKKPYSKRASPMNKLEVRTKRIAHEGIKVPDGYTAELLSKESSNLHKIKRKKP